MRPPPKLDPAAVRFDEVPGGGGRGNGEREAKQGAATTFRAIDPKAPPRKLPTLYGASPLVEAKGGELLVIERIDGPAERHSVSLKGTALARGKFYDFAKAGKALTPGATYLATLGPRKFTFTVDASAMMGPTPIVGCRRP